VKISLTPTPLL